MTGSAGGRNGIQAPEAPGAGERRSETRWPAFVGITVALVLYLLVQNPETAAVRTIAVAILVSMLLPLLAINPHRLNRQTQWSRWLSVSFTALLVIANQVNVAYVIGDLLTGSVQGAEVLLTALQV